MKLKRCNGCMTELAGDSDHMNRFDGGGQRNPRVVIEGRRVDGLSGTFDGTLLRNNEEFHWCMKCTQVAFRAVDDAAAT
jgi:hypothetical protein